MKIVGGIFCDLHKACDCAIHYIILYNSELCRTKRSFLRLINPYLEGRWQEVQISLQNNNNLTSRDWRKISHGLPQGPVLRPLLFLMYVCINGIPVTLEHNVIPVLGTDDSSLITSNTDNNSQQYLIN